MFRKVICVDYKYGVLGFRYNSEHFIPLKSELERNGVYTVNAGDNMQTIAARSLYRTIGIQDDQITTINRDDLPNYSGNTVVLIMNGCFYEPCFPISNQIIPIFIGFNAPETVIEKNKYYLKKHEPIGCRDQTTRTFCEKHGIIAYTSGCITLTFPKRFNTPSIPKTFIIHGKGAGDIPESLLSFAPPNIIRQAELILQRLPMHIFPLGESESNQADQFALNLLERYRNEATLVITPLLHAACPCIALGIPVILARKDYDSRFTAISRLLPVYTPEHFNNINWNPDVVNVENIKAHMIALIKHLIEEIPKKHFHANSLNSVYAANEKLVYRSKLQ